MEAPKTIHQRETEYREGLRHNQKQLHAKTQRKQRRKEERGLIFVPFLPLRLGVRDYFEQKKARGSPVEDIDT
jgi:hypothetical protein